MSAVPSRILIVRLSHLGDVVQTLPLFHALRAEYPAARIAWAIQPEFAGLLAGHPGLDRAILFDRRGGARAWWRLARELESFGADWTVDAQGNVKSAMVALCARAARRSGYATVDWRERFAASSVTDPCPRGSPREHAVERVLRLARHVAPNSCGSPRFDVGLSAVEIEAAERRLATLVRADGGTLLHLSHPGDVRAWPVEHFAALARASAERAPVVVVSGPGEVEHGRALERDVRHPRVAHVVGQRGLRELAALFTACARRGMTFVGCDSGPMHLAWSSGMRVVLLAGPQDERRTGPYPLGSPHETLRAEPSPPCAPCMSRRCTHERGPVCMSELRPGQVDVALGPRAGHPATRVVSNTVKL